jgi:hypothetical protein
MEWVIGDSCLDEGAGSALQLAMESNNQLLEGFQEAIFLK